MKQKKLKVFHGLVNYGTQAGLFAKELRKHGIDAISVSYPDPYKRLIDVELLYGGNIIQKILKHLWNWIRRFYWFCSFNTFHFYFGSTLFPKQWDLRFYKFFRKKVIMEYLGYDVQLYQYSLNKYKITNVEFYKPHLESIIADQIKIKRLKYESKYLDKQIVCAPYLSEFVPNSIILPLAIDLDKYIFSPRPVPVNEIVIMHAPTDFNNKGTSFIIDAIDKLINEEYNIKKLIIENVKHDELINKYLECDIFIDQVLGGWYGTAAVEAMALGRPTLCFIREEYFRYIDYGEKIPIINANPTNIYEVLKKTIENKNLLPEIGYKSRKFVEEIHDLKKLTIKLISIYN